MKLADVLGGKLKGAKHDPNAVHRDTLKRLLKLSDAEVSELSFAIRALSEGDEVESEEPESGKKAPSLAAILGKGSSTKGE